MQGRNSMTANSKIGACAILSKIVFLLKKFIITPLYNILKFIQHRRTCFFLETHLMSHYIRKSQQQNLKKHNFFSGKALQKQE